MNKITKKQEKNILKIQTMIFQNHSDEDIYQAIIDLKISSENVNYTSATLYDNTALLLAVSHGRTKSITKLLELGGDPNIKNMYGGFALSHACVDDRLDLANLLIEYGAEIEDNELSFNIAQKTREHVNRYYLSFLNNSASINRFKNDIILNKEHYEKKMDKTYLAGYERILKEIDIKLEDIIAKEKIAENLPVNSYQEVKIKL